MTAAATRNNFDSLLDKIGEILAQRRDSNRLENDERVAYAGDRNLEVNDANIENDVSSRAIGVSSSPLLSPMQVSELEVDGWEMIFRAQSGNGQNVYDAWRLGTGVTTVKPTSVGRSYASHYRDSRVAQWNSLSIRQVKFALYFENREVAFIIFDGTGSDYINWFDKTRVIASSYSDLTSTGTYNYFSFAGHERGNFHYRRFFVNKSYAGCPGDLGWLDVADVGTSGPCDMDKHAALPQFLYSSINAADQWERGRYGRADYMAIFVKTM